MRSLTLSICLFFSVRLLAQIPVEGTSHYASPQAHYVLTVKGLAYEGFIGPQSVSLRNALGQLLWTKSQGLFFRPAVTDGGIVALGNQSIQFFDRTGAELGSYPFSPAGDLPWNDCGDCIPGYRFSPDGSLLYLIVRNRTTHDLLCLNNRGLEQWRFPVRADTLYGLAINYNFLPFHGGVVLSTRTDGWSTTSECFLLSDSGIVVATYKSQDLPLFMVDIQDSANTFTIREDDTLSTYGLDSGMLQSRLYTPLKRKPAASTTK